MGHVPSECDPVAAGIDALLFWTPTGTRKVDAMVRDVLRACKATSPGGTVQQLNSLRGPFTGMTPVGAIACHTSPTRSMWCQVQ
jgi:hypothetical protein